MPFIDVPDGEGTNFEQAFALRPDVFRAWQQLNGAIKESSDLRRYELATLAAARRLRSSYCCLAHGRVLAEQLGDPAVVRAVSGGPDDAGLSPVDRAVARLADRVAGGAADMTEDDLAELRDLGLPDDEI